MERITEQPRSVLTEPKRITRITESGGRGPAGIGTVASVGTLINTATAKITPVDADLFGIRDSVSGLLQKLSWANIKATLKTYFDTRYVLATTTSITAAALKALKDASQLSPGRRYLITDYRNTGSVEYSGIDDGNGGLTFTTFEGPLEPLYVWAVSESELDPRAVSTIYPDDIITYTLSNEFFCMRDYGGGPYASYYDPNVLYGTITYRYSVTKDGEMWEDFYGTKFRRFVDADGFFMLTDTLMDPLMVEGVDYKDCPFVSDWANSYGFSINHHRNDSDGTHYRCNVCVGINEGEEANAYRLTIPTGGELWSIGGRASGNDASCCASVKCAGSCDASWFQLQSAVANVHGAISGSEINTECEIFGDANKIIIPKTYRSMSSVPIYTNGHGGFEMSQAGVATFNGFPLSPEVLTVSASKMLDPANDWMGQFGSGAGYIELNNNEETVEPDVTPTLVAGATYMALILVKNWVSGSFMMQVGGGTAVDAGLAGKGWYFLELTAETAGTLNILNTNAICKIYMVSLKRVYTSIDFWG